jgi:hypothetical protein
MLTVKLMKYNSSGDSNRPATAEVIAVRECNAAHVLYDKDGRTVLQLGDAPGSTMEVTIGDRKDCSYSVAYIMNEAGRTVETIR